MSSPGSDTAGTAAADPAASSRPEGGLPFRDAELPAGTHLTVRLAGPIQVEPAVASGRFEATLDEPVGIDGNIVVPQGASASGRVEAAQASARKGSRGSLRLVLESIDISGREIPIHTSSLFTRGNAPNRETSSAAVSLEKGHRLTFRLSEPALLTNQSASLNH